MADGQDLARRRHVRRRSGQRNTLVMQERITTP
jgi:hypothetical protein